VQKKRGFVEFNGLAQQPTLAAPSRAVQHGSSMSNLACEIVFAVSTIRKKVRSLGYR
jgi:hypothetical protein